jgi:3-isopropylmalate/(R)-2-methylmalate dehydratase small subunit
MSGPLDSRVTDVTGRALPVAGDDIDTDRIMPARFLKAVSFDGLEVHLFEDDRRAARDRHETHPVDDARYQGASVLVVGRNFGCGSSREHAPQGIARWGIRAIVGVSFAEIFFSNATSLGLACVSVTPDAARELASIAEQSPETHVTVDLIGQRVQAGQRQWEATMAASARQALVTGTWDATAMLTAEIEAVRATAARLPYITGF